MGNNAFKERRHLEAVEHYTAALACSVESRPFAAICFCNRAAAYQALNQITDAIADCSLAIALDENYPKVCHLHTKFPVVFLFSVKYIIFNIVVHVINMFTLWSQRVFLCFIGLSSP